VDKSIPNGSLEDQAGGRSVYLSWYEAVLGVCAVQPVEVQSPVTGAGFGLGCWPLQPEPVIDAEAVPLIEVDVTVPDVDAVIVQALHVSAGKVIE
jgi:hypothetical protein